MASEQNGQRANHEDGDEPSFFDEGIFERVRTIKREHEEYVDGMDASIARIRNELQTLKSSLTSIPKEERRLMTVLVTRSIKRSLREILLEQVGTAD